jgi:cell division septal protein FtsQ
MWLKRKFKNRRLGRAQVLDVKLRSSQVVAARTRLAAIALGVSFGAVFGLYVAWRLGQWTLNKLVYENKSFAIQNVEIETDGVIAIDQLRRWCAVKAGENLLALDLARVKHDLELAPMIQAVSVERVLPGTLKIRVTEREPVAQVNVVHTGAGGGVEFLVFQLDAEGFVIVPLDPRQRAVPLDRVDDQLPLLAGFNGNDLRPGRKIDSLQSQSALRLITAFDRSPVAGLTDLRSIDVSRRDTLVVTTSQGSEVTFGMEDFPGQLRRWQVTLEEALRRNQAIATLDLAVTNNTPLRLQEAGPPPPAQPKNAKPQRTRRRNV